MITKERREMFDKVLLLNMLGQDQKTIAIRAGTGTRMVGALTRIYAVVSAKDGPNWEEAARIAVQYNAAMDLIEWVGETANVEVPENLYEQIANMRKQKAAKAAAAPAPAPAPQETPEAGPEPQEGPAAPPPTPDHWNEEKLLLQTLIMAVKQQGELLEQLYDVVLPKWVGDLKDNHNANSDVQTQALKRIEDKLEAIKINVRRRGA